MSRVSKPETYNGNAERQSISRRITEIYAELDAMPLVVASKAQFAREIELDAELTVLKEKLFSRRK